MQRTLLAVIMLAVSGLTPSPAYSSTRFVPEDDQYVLAKGGSIALWQSIRPGSAAPKPTERSIDELAAELDRYLRLARQEKDLSYAGMALSILRASDERVKTHGTIALLYADILQYTHQFDAAIARLSDLANNKDYSAKAHLKLVPLQMMRGEFAKAEYSCRQLQTLLAYQFSLICNTWIQGVTENLGDNVMRLQRLQSLLPQQDSVSLWAQEVRLDLLLQSGRYPEALQALQSHQQASESADLGMVKMAVDYFLLAKQTRAALVALDPYADQKTLYLRQIICAHVNNKSDAAMLQAGAELIDTYIAAKQRDKYFDIALWKYLVEHDSHGALAYAQQNWAGNQYVNDALLLRAIAMSESNEPVLATLEQWRKSNNIQSPLLFSDEA